VSNVEPGSIDDSVRLLIEGKEIKIVESYECKVSVLQQPAAFSLKTGWGGTIAGLRKQVNPGDSFQLLVGDVPVQAGRVDAVNVPDGNISQVEIKGRDWTQVLFKSSILNEVSFSQRTFRDVTEKVLEIVGLGEHSLIGFNDANRQMMTHKETKVVAKENPASDQISRQDAGLTEAGDVQTITTESLRAKVGETWWQWLQRQYKLAGIYLWCTADGSFVISSPDPNQVPSYNIQRRRNQTRVETNIEGCQFTNDAAGRYALYVVNGRYGAGAGGRGRYSADFADIEMADWGFTEPYVIYDNDVKSQRQAEYRARRECAEHRRAGWNLHYTMAGHIVPTGRQIGDFKNWGPDLLCRVNDEEIGITGDYYIDAVTFSRNEEKTTTRIELMRADDMQWLAEDLSELTKKQRKVVLQNASVLGKR